MISARLLSFAVSLLVPVMAHGAASYQLLTPRSISVPGGESHDVSIRVLDATGRPAAGESVGFANDVCGAFAGAANPYVTRVNADSNGVATVRFTASNPPGITCWITIDAGFTTVVNVLTYRLNEVVMQAAPLPSDPPIGREYTLHVVPGWGAYGLKNVDVTAHVVPGKGTATLSDAVLSTGEAGYADFTVTPGQVGDYTIEVAYRTRLKDVAMPAPAAPWQDLWWVGQVENGWGVSIVQHRDMLFTMFYTYDAGGKPTWYVVSSGTWNAAHTAFTGDAYVPSGTPYYAYDTSRFKVGAPVGSVTITFTGAASATLDYSLDGKTGHKEITRYAFGPAQAAPIHGLTDMWWGGVAQNGWGIAALQQYAQVFMVWFTYDADGAPTWYSMPAGGWLDGQTYAGRIYKTSGSPWLGATYDATRFASTDVGSFRLRFSGDNASFDYALEGRTGSVPLSRTPF